MQDGAASTHAPPPNERLRRRRARSLRQIQPARSLDEALSLSAECSVAAGGLTSNESEREREI